MVALASPASGAEPPRVAEPVAPRIESVTYASAVLNRQRRFTVVLPDGFVRERTGWPVLYQLHGRGRPFSRHHPHLTPDHHRHPTAPKRRMRRRELPLRIPPLDPLVLPVLTAHAHIPPDQPQVRPVAARTNRHPPKPVVARIACPSMASPHRATTAPFQPFRRRALPIGLGPHARAPRHLQGRSHPVTPKHRPTGQQLGLEVGHPRGNLGGGRRRGHGEAAKVSLAGLWQHLHHDSTRTREKA